MKIKRIFEYFLVIRKEENCFQFEATILQFLIKYVFETELLFLKINLNFNFNN